VFTGKPLTLNVRPKQAFDLALTAWAERDIGDDFVTEANRGIGLMVVYL